MTSRSWAALLMLAVAGCGSTAVVGDEFGGPPRSFRGFPPLTLEGIVYAEARYADHAQDIGIDLVAYERIVPIMLKVQLRGAGADEAQIMLDPRRMNLRLILQDGTVLPLSDFDEVASRQDVAVATKLRDRAFRGGLLDAPREGYVLFGLRPTGEFDISGRVIRHARGGVVRSFDLADSLLAFNLSIGADSTVHPFYVGIQR